MKGFSFLWLSFKLFFKRPAYLLFSLFNIMVFILTYYSLNFFERWVSSFIFPFIALFTVFYFFSLTAVAVSFFSKNELEQKPISVVEALLFGIQKSWKIIQMLLFLIALVGSSVLIVYFAGLIAQLRGIASWIFFVGIVFWGIITFFIYPMIACEEESTFLSIKSSACLFKETWRRIFFPYLIFWVITTLLGFLAIYLFVAIFFGGGWEALFGLSVVHFVLAPTGFGLFVGFFALLKTIFKTVVYFYCADKPSDVE